MDGVTGGTPPGTNSTAQNAAWPRNPLRAGYTAAAVLLLAAVLVNISTQLHDAPASLPAWKPVTWELTSYCGSLVSLWIAFRAVRIAPLSDVRRARTVAIHLGAATAYSAVHCLTMWTLRRLVYGLVGAHYGWQINAAQFLYEYRKDLLTYGVTVFLYWCLTRLAAAHATAAAAAPPAAAAPTMLDIRDGARLVRAPIADIVAAEADGNYATILLRDGRRPLMRTTLASLETTLAPHGFLRVHRSWIANPASIRAIEPTGAGDYRLNLEGGLTAPLSRRYAAAVRGNQK